MGLKASSLRGSQAAELRVDVTANTDQAKGDLEGMGKHVDGIGGKLGTLAAVGFAGATAAAGVFAVKAVMGASDLNEQVSKTQVVFGDASQSVVDWANHMADAFGLPKAEMIEAAGQIGLVGKASGLTQDKAAALGTQFAGLAADASSFYNVPLSDALQAIQSGLVGEAEPLRKYGVLLSDAAVKAEAVRLGIAKAGDELTEQQKVQARASLITQGMTDATGDLSRTQDSFANRLREVQGRAENFATSLGMKLLPVILWLWDRFDAFTAWAGATFAPLFERIEGAVTTFVAALSGNALPTNDGLTAFMQRAGEFVRELIPKLENLWNMIQRGVDAVGGWGNIFKVIAAAMFPIGAAIAFVIAKWDTIGPIVQNVLDTVVPIVTEMAQAIWGEMQSIWGTIQAIWPDIQKIIATVMDTIKTIIDVDVAVIKWIWDTFGQSILGVIQGTWTAIWGIIQGALDIIKGIIQVAVSIFAGDWGGAWDGIKTTLAGVWEIMWGIVKGGFDAFKAIFSNGLEILKNLFGGAWDWIKSTVTTKTNELISFITGIPGSIVSAIGDLSSTLYNAGLDIIGGFFKGITDKFEDVKDMVGGIGVWISDHKGPISYDRKLLVSHGQAIMAGLGQGLTEGFAGVQSLVDGMAPRIALDASANVTGSVGASGTPGGISDGAAPMIGQMIVHQAQSDPYTLLQATFWEASTTRKRLGRAA